MTLWVWLLCVSNLCASGYIEKSTYQGLDDHYSALEDTLRDECERKAMRPETQEPQPIDRFDEESVSSVEDPITEIPRIRSPVRSRVAKRGYVASAWTTDKDGIRSRTCTYTMALNHAMAPKSCVVTEKQQRRHSKPVTVCELMT
ncbi:hypothetical protein ANCDUO_10046 [Ancylostoma duodenale]|uniref:VASt domain-containing protein n=1 Tax=Ancylostoma duodenale TaxID=51022 RepID=A0A0C2DBB4_9BILA|nr:hypothetical protein ANCDUO_10046 [Ancylostoma duodenale]